MTIADGTTALEGDGPIKGVPRALGMVAMGNGRDGQGRDVRTRGGSGTGEDEISSNVGEFPGNIDTRGIEHRGEPLSRFATNFALLRIWRA